MSLGLATHTYDNLRRDFINKFGIENFGCEGMKIILRLKPHT